MTRYLPLVSLLIACAGSAPESTSPLEAVARAALNCPVGTLSWATDGGSIDQRGFFSAPACVAPYNDITYHVTVTGCGNSTVIPVTVGDQLRSLSIYCGVITPETCCRPPPWTITPDQQIQMYAALQYNCSGHVVYSQTPPPMCP